MKQLNKQIESKLAPVLRAYKEGLIDFDFTMDSILRITPSESKMTFNQTYSLGLVVGGIITFVITSLINL